MFNKLPESEVPFHYCALLHCNYFENCVIDYNLKQHCKEVHGKAKLGKRQKRSRSVRLRKNLQRRKGKRDNGENLDSSCSGAQAEESENSANT